MQERRCIKVPYKPKKPCKYQGCPKLTNGMFCDEHKHTESRRYNKYQRDPAINKKYGAQWRKIRARYIKVHPLCEECAVSGRLTPATEVHHILPLSEGGTHDESNFAALCHPCHSSITMRANNKKRHGD